MSAIEHWVIPSSDRYVALDIRARETSSSHNGLTPRSLSREKGRLVRDPSAP